MTGAAEPARFPLVASGRFIAPAAVVVGVLGALTLGDPVPRLACAVGAAALLVGWGWARLGQPVLLVDEAGYRVEERGRERLRVGFVEVRRARAVPADEAMYLDCGDPKRNLLLPPRRGFGFRFARQGELYVRLARALADRLEIVAHLDAPAASAVDVKPPPAGANGVARHG